MIVIMTLSELARSRQEVSEVMEKLLYDVMEAAGITSLGRTKLLEEIAAGRLRSVKVGRRRLISRAALEDYVAGLSGDAVSGGLGDAG